jgi:hypothetical protein
LGLSIQKQRSDERKSKCHTQIYSSGEWDEKSSQRAIVKESQILSAYKNGFETNNVNVGDSPSREQLSS